MKTLELSRWIRQMLQHIQAHHGVEPLIGAAFEIPVHRELASKTQRSCPLRNKSPIMRVEVDKPHVIDALQGRCRQGVGADAPTKVEHLT